MSNGRGREGEREGGGGMINVLKIQWQQPCELAAGGTGIKQAGRISANWTRQSQGSAESSEEEIWDYA